MAECVARLQTPAPRGTSDRSAASRGRSSGRRINKAPRHGSIRRPDTRTAIREERCSTAGRPAAERTAARTCGGQDTVTLPVAAQSGATMNAMSRATELVAVVVFLLAHLSQPLALDACSLSCEAARAARRA